MTPLQLFEQGLIASGFTKTDDPIDVNDDTKNYCIDRRKEYINLWFNDELIVFTLQEKVELC